MRKFWSFLESGEEECVLRLDGEIASESWWGDEVTPKAFMGELENYAGKNITVFINSPGGDVIAGSQIYTALKEHKGQVTVKVDGIAASAASVIAMAGDYVYMSPTSFLMLHDPMTFAMGNENDMEQAKAVLRECKEGIINAYELKTGLSRAKLSQLMSDETWMNARKAVELGFADKILYTDSESETDIVLDSYIFGRRAIFNSLVSKFPKVKDDTDDTPKDADDVPSENSEGQLPEEASDTMPDEPSGEEIPSEGNQEEVPSVEDNKSYLTEIENLRTEFEII